MKLDKILFATVLAMCAVVALTVLLANAGAGSAAHPEHATMRHGGSGIERHGDMLWVGWLFGATMILTLAALIAYGARRYIRDLGRWLAVATACVLCAWTWLVLSYRDYLHDPAPELHLALPAPTAVMMYLFWPLTMAFVLCFVLGFNRWVLSDEDVETYERLLTARRREDGVRDG